jgi:hypothetical protein
MNELAWRRLEQKLAGEHATADPPLQPAIWRGVEAALAAPPARRGVWLALAGVVLAAAGLVLWLSPGPGPASPPAPPVALPAPAPAPVAPPVPAPMPVPVNPGPPRVLNQVVEPAGSVTFVIASDAGRIEIEPCRGRFVNVTVLDSPHQRLELVERGRRVDVRFDGDPAMAGGVAHILVPADTHVIVTTRSGPVIIRGLGGPIEIETQSGELQLDTAPRLDPSVTAVSDSGAITWRGRCGRGCRVDARSRTGEITLRAPDPAAFTHGAAHGESQRGRVHLEELTCTEPRCSSSPLPWRQPAAAPH